MDKSRFLRIWEISALVSLCVCLCAAVWAQGRSSAISADLVRLHVLAVSDDARMLRRAMPPMTVLAFRR